jgi:hypothetical protein
MVRGGREEPGVRHAANSHIAFQFQRNRAQIKHLQPMAARRCQNIGRHSMPRENVYTSLYLVRLCTAEKGYFHVSYRQPGQNREETVTQDETRSTESLNVVIL